MRQLIAVHGLMSNRKLKGISAFYALVPSSQTLISRSLLRIYARTKMHCSHFAASQITVCRFLFALLITVGTATFGIAEAPAFAYREWKDSSSQFSVTARLVAEEPPNVILERQDNGDKIEISKAKLSYKDRAYLRDVSRQQVAEEKLRKAIQSLAFFRKQIDPGRDEILKPQQGSETTTQYRERRNSAYRSILGLSAKQEFTVIAEIEDVRQSEITYDFNTQLNMNFESPAAARKRMANEAAYFDIKLVERAYPMVVPTTIRAKIGTIGKRLKVGDSIQIECTASNAAKAIGRMNLTVPDTNAETKFYIVSISLIKSDAVDRYLASLQKTHGLRLRIDSRRMSGEQFMFEVKRLGNAEFSLPAIVPNEDFEKRFGRPYKKMNIATGEMWGFECNDGIVVIWVRTGVEQLYPNSVFIERMLLDTENRATP